MLTFGQQHQKAITIIIYNHQIYNILPIIISPYNFDFIYNYQIYNILPIII